MKTNRLSLPAFFLSVLLCGLLPPMQTWAAPATAIVTVSPASGTMPADRNFTVNFWLDTGGQSAGAILLDVTYSSNLEFVEADAGGSVFNQVLTAPDPSNNHFRSSRMRFDEGFNGSNGLILAVTFLPVAAGNGTIEINGADSEVVAFSDSSNILSTAQNGNYLFEIPALQAGGEGGAGGGTGAAGKRLADFLERVEELPEVKMSEEVVEEPKADSLPPLPCLPENPDPLPGRRARLIAMVEGEEIVFHDVPVKAWYARPVAALTEAGVISGYRDNRGEMIGFFGPGDPVTYAELAKIAIGALQRDAKLPSDPPRNASAIGHWSQPYVAFAEREGFSVFSSSPPIGKEAKRGEVVQTLLEALKIPMGARVARFPDVAERHPHSHAIAAAHTLGIVRGDTDEEGNLRSRFRPDDAVNRAEVARMAVGALSAACASDPEDQ